MPQQQHFLVVSCAAQSHINPNLHLCRRLALTAGASVTFSTTISGYRRMFPASDSLEFHDGLISHIPFSDGNDDGNNRDDNNSKDFNARSKSIGTDTLSALIRSLSVLGRPVTCVIYTLFLSWVGDVARAYGLPSVFFWIQSATIFAINYHFFHGYDCLIAAHARDPGFVVELPGLPPIQMRDLPSFLTITDPEDPFAAITNMMRENFDEMDRAAAAGSRMKVLVNSFEELEDDALAVDVKLKLVPIGPVISFPLLEGGKEGDGTGDMFMQDEKPYMDWLDSKAEKSVVYVSFGSFAKIKKRQAEEIQQGLLASGRPYLWVVRKDNREELGGGKLEEDEGKGMVVEWCSQVKVLSHKAVGCFVTHCGWNSTMESLVCGVPSVAVPHWVDQMMNARMMENWGTGMRSKLEWEGAWEGEELRRCLEVVMGEGEKGNAMRRRAAMWKEKARRAVRVGGLSDWNLRAFVEEMGAAIN